MRVLIKQLRRNYEENIEQKYHGRKVAAVKRGRFPSNTCYISLRADQA